MSVERERERNRERSACVCVVSPLHGDGHALEW
eukprot:COSAG06_NODE_65809_length_256_cov_0.649682_1_plen_32_part_01